MTIHASTLNRDEKPRRAVFVDRDGVINHMFFNAEFGTVDSPANPEQFALLPGVGQAIAELNRAGLLVIVVSNQPGIAKGKFTLALLEAMENKMARMIEADGGRLDAIYNCLHHPSASLSEYRILCKCRKPEPGLLVRAASDWGIDLSSSYMIGDGVTDIAAGRAAGATTLFVSSRKCYNCDSLAEHGVWPDYLVRDLPEAVIVVRNLEAGDRGAVRQFELKCAPL
ncbi:MAG TPA: HAD family hydrolase [Blastocatellia bacterium]|jgi:D-glycero-D-manno-heptose 1,7-bisphosphate phosphatase